MRIDGKKLINPIIMIVSGILGYIFPIFNHWFGYGAGIEDSDFDLSGGYEFIGKDLSNGDAQFCRVMCAILLVITLVAAGVLIIVGIINLLAALKVNIPVFVQYESVWNKIGIITFLVFAIAHVIEFILLIIFSVCNNYDDLYLSDWSRYVDIKYAPGVGAYLMMIFSVVECVAVIVIDCLLVSKENGPQILYVCSACNKRVKAGSRFCDSCGGAVFEKKQFPEVYMCVTCGKKASPKDRFCAVCGGAIEKREIYPVVCFCSSCGKTVTNQEKFCSSCGGAIVAKKTGPEDYAAKTGGYFCSKCGKGATNKEKFCTSCGGTIVAHKLNTNENITPAFFCSACGKGATDKDKFCSTCGGAIVAKQTGEQTDYKPLMIYLCSACGNGATKNDKFCSKCGGAIVEKQMSV